MADILASYLPENLLDSGIPLKEKLQSYANFLSDHGFVNYARASADKDKVVIAANGCAFARIHDSDAYQKLEIRFCPWGMIGSAIVAAHEGKGTVLKSSLFTTRGSVSEIETK